MSIPLDRRTCVPCEAGSGLLPLTPEEIESYLGQLHTDWRVVDNTRIAQKFTFKDFAEAIIFVNKIAEIAESENHHPDISISYRKVMIELSTHAIRGLSENDFILAAKIEQIS